MRLVPPILMFLTMAASAAMVGPYSPPAGQPGSTAVSYYSESGEDFFDSRIADWATEVTSFNPGRQDISNVASPLANFGTPANALGPADAYGSDNFSVVSLGDGGSITLKFAHPISNGPGADLAVFENGFDDNFLELAFVEVSSDGTNFYRFPSVSLTQTSTQVGSFGTLDTTQINNLAGKFRSGFGTPFDLDDLKGKAGLDLSSITHIRIVDVVGDIDPTYAQYDSQGHIINDPWKTNFSSGGFDLDAVAYLSIPEPGAVCLLALAVGIVTRRRRNI